MHARCFTIFLSLNPPTQPTATRCLSFTLSSRILLSLPIPSFSTEMRKEWDRLFHLWSLFRACKSLFKRRQRSRTGHRVKSSCQSIANYKHRTQSSEVENLHWQSFFVSTRLNCDSQIIVFSCCSISGRYREFSLNFLFVKKLRITIEEQINFHTWKI